MSHAPGAASPRSIEHLLPVPLATGALIAVVGGLTLLLDQPLLFPSLGPTVYMQLEAPEHPTSRLYNVIVGHYVGLASGVVAVLLFGLRHKESIFINPEDAGLPLAAAAVTAIVLTTFINLLLDASHPPAASTTLLVVLGGFSVSAQDIGAVLAGVVVVGVVGEPLRRLRLRWLARAGGPWRRRGMQSALPGAARGGQGDVDQR